MSETARSDIVAAARSWLGTRYRHQGRDRSGVDCIGMVICIAHDLGLTQFDFTAYGRVPDGASLLQVAGEQMRRVRVREIRPGDVVAMRFESEPQHFAVVADYPLGGLSIIHALALSRKVVEHRLDEVWRSRIVAAYELPGVA